MIADTGTPGILLVEDDPVSAAFLDAAASALPATVDRAATCADAERMAGAGTHALWLIDAHLPDGDGTALLARLRARGMTTPALAHTAAHDPAALDALVAAGFDHAVAKPLTALALQDAIRHLLGSVPPHAQSAPVAAFDALPLWDDTAAVAALNGNRGHVSALRALCVAELPKQRDDIADAAANGDLARLHATLHRLQASCGFVGAARLAAAVRALQGAPHSPEALARFDDVIGDTVSTGVETGISQAD